MVKQCDDDKIAVMNFFALSMTRSMYRDYTDTVSIWMQCEVVLSRHSGSYGVLIQQQTYWYRLLLYIKIWNTAKLFMVLRRTTPKGPVRRDRQMDAYKKGLIEVLSRALLDDWAISVPKCCWSFMPPKLIVKLHIIGNGKEQPRQKCSVLYTV